MSTELPTRIFEARRGRRQIDRRAWTCLKRCQRKLRIDEIPLPVPVEQWIEGPLGIGFGVTDLSYLGADVHGAAFISDREILVDQSVIDHEGRYRFTCAHELGHLILHRNVQGVFHETSELGPGSANKYERQADRFAAAFLMPLPLLEREFVRILDHHGMDRAKCTVELMSTSQESEWLWRTRFLPPISHRFGVSLSAAVNRFNDIQPRLPEPQPLLPFEFAQELLRPAKRDGQYDSISMVNGVPTRCDLFTISKEGASAGE